MPDAAKRAESGGLVVSASPLLTDEESQELFEANLPLNGILPIRIELINRSKAPINLRSAKVSAHNGDGEWKLLTVKQTVAQIMKANGITLYNPGSRKQFTQDVALHSIDVKSVLAEDEKRQGIVFLKSPGKKPVQSPTGLVFSIEKIGTPIEITLN